MLHYKTYLKSPNHEWIVFVHGAGGSSSIWYKQIREFKREFNILLLDLRGHGRSKSKRLLFRSYSFQNISEDVLEVMDHLDISRAHFVGISLGTILIQTIAEMEPSRVRSMTLGGAVMKLNLRSRLLIRLGNAVKAFVPFMWLYRLFAWVIMPNKHHEHSRSLFIREAKKLCQKEFKRWFTLTMRINPFLKDMREREAPVPTLYIMGKEDYMFLPAIQMMIGRKKYSSLLVLKNCGHVCNVDQPDRFNSEVLDFIRKHCSVTVSVS
ncbi:alpha/beta fold hydrolase [Fictibacillus fluitans]|uniref:Alpha/beta hydrolase n=1 Tax=Fictibacillus fluitans TaxID=3058422 RepID=A0ABT8HVE5_9BACL|nr:alpha/beta hydrolase [Fictibacillus sp. NE201]MDN4524708.1 alpha/beta hydrolase [Fictibacillus sp. NE201]